MTLRRTFNLVAGKRYVIKFKPIGGTAACTTGNGGIIQLFTDSGYSAGYVDSGWVTRGNYARLEFISNGTDYAFMFTIDSSYLVLDNYGFNITDGNGTLLGSSLEILCKSAVKSTSNPSSKSVPKNNLA